jgi:hypothetical protein
MEGQMIIQEYSEYSGSTPLIYIFEKNELPNVRKYGASTLESTRDADGKYMSLVVFGRQGWPARRWTESLVPAISLAPIDEYFWRALFGSSPQP